LFLTSYLLIILPIAEAGRGTAKKYLGPKLPPINVVSDTKRPTDNKPVYVDGQGRLYDAFYRPFTEQDSKRLMSSRLEQPGAFPSHLDYATFSEYQAAVLAWRQRTEESLANLQLPQLMGRAYPRPRVPKLSADEAEEEDNRSDADDDNDGTHGGCIFPDDVCAPEPIGHDSLPPSQSRPTSPTLPRERPEDTVLHLPPAALRTPFWLS
jgi:hypothetical protein